MGLGTEKDVSSIFQTVSIANMETLNIGLYENVGLKLHQDTITLKTRSDYTKTCETVGR